MSKLWKATKRIVIGLAVLVGIALIVVAFMNWRAGRRVASCIESIREAGDPVAFVDLIPPPVDPADNAVTYLLRALDDAIAVDNELSPLRDNEERYYVEGQLNDEGADRVRETLNAYPDVISLSIKASNSNSYVSSVDLTGNFSDIVNSTLEQVQKLRSVTRVLRWHAELHIHDGKHDEAIESCLAIMRLAHLGDAEPFLVANLVTHAVRGIGCDAIAETLIAGTISNASRQKIEQELERHDGMSGYLYSLKAERVLFINGFHQNIPPIIRHLPPFVNSEFDGLSIFDAYIGIAGRPRYQVSQEITAVEKHASSTGVLAQSIVPALLVARDAADRTQVVMRCTRVLVALDGFLDNAPSADPTLAELDAPVEVKVDPYTGAPLRLKKTGDGWIVYSVGANLVDDGGMVGNTNREDVGVGPVRGE